MLQLTKFSLKSSSWTRYVKPPLGMNDRFGVSANQIENFRRELSSIFELYGAQRLETPIMEHKEML